jgi:hypothetical protein
MKFFLVALVTVSVALAAVPRAYVSLASISGGVGYHGWTMRNRGPRAAWLDAGLQAVEGAWFLNPHLGLGLRVLDVALSPVTRDSAEFTFLSTYATMFATFEPTLFWVLHHGAGGFGYLNLALMPYMPDNSGQTPVASSGFALDYGYVPLAHRPVEARIRAAAMVFNWSGNEMAWQVSAGVRAGLGWWFMQREGPAQN